MKINKASARPKVYVVTTHGRQELVSEGNERLCELLGRSNVPWSAVSIYAVPTDGGEPRLDPCLDRLLDEFDGVSELLLYFNRNLTSSPC